MSRHKYAISTLERVLRGEEVEIKFISPLVAACLSARALRYPNQDRISISGSATTYAETVGLAAALGGRDPGIPPLEGRTYSPLVRLDGSAVVDQCNVIIAQFIRRQFGANGDVAAAWANVVGELHDNVASHARGVGFSAAQFYGVGNTLDFVIADAGVGMLSNVRRAGIDALSSHIDAIEWCVERGNTTARPRDDWAQFLPEDAQYNPYGDSVPTAADENNHAGLGLAILSETARTCEAKLMIWSGDAQYFVDRGQISARRSAEWCGVVVGVQLPVISGAPDDRIVHRTESHEDLARRLGL